MPRRSRIARLRHWILARSGLSNLERHELQWLVAGLAACILLFLFVRLAGEVTEGDTQAFDTRILKLLRDPVDPARPIGPVWMEGALLDLTALGGSTVLSLMVLSIVGFLTLQARYRTALFVMATAITGEVLNQTLKNFFQRPRPEIVPPLRVVFSSSFPSGHAMESAIVYLTLGSMLMRVADNRLTKLYCIGMATLLTLLVGLSRVYLGVHYPTDVIGGWIVGFMWASICWLVAERFEYRAGIAAERKKTKQP